MLLADEHAERNAYAKLIDGLGNSICMACRHNEVALQRKIWSELQLVIMVLSEGESPHADFFEFIQKQRNAFWMIFCRPNFKEPLVDRERYLGRFSRPNLSLGEAWQKSFLLVMRSALRTTRRRLGYESLEELLPVPTMQTNNALYAAVQQSWKKPDRIPKIDARAIVIGISTGGPQSLSQMLPFLCKVTDLPILIVQHMGEGFTSQFAASLDLLCSHKCKEAEQDELIQNHTVYIAPGGAHMELKHGSKGVMIHLHKGPMMHSCRPAVDVLLPTANRVLVGHLIALILTGMGSDGSLSLAELKRSRAVILAQDEDSSIVWGMPAAAIATGHVDAVVPLMAMPEMVRLILNKT